MGFIFKTVLVIYILVFGTDAHLGTTEKEFDVDVFTNSSDCRKMDRIMNGTIATHEMFPFLVSIQTSSTGQHFCGGTLLTPYHVLTAAHCTFMKSFNKQLSPNELQIRVGLSNLRFPAKVVARVKWFKIHEGYKQRPIDNDIAVMKVDVPLTSKESDIPCLSSSFILPSPKIGPCTAVGWGRLGPDPYPTEQKSTFNTQVVFPTNNSFPLSNNHTLNSTHPSNNVSNHAYNETHHGSIGLNSSQVTNSTGIFNMSSPVPGNVSFAPSEPGRAYGAGDYGSREILLRYTFLPLQDFKECAKDYPVAGITNAVLCAGKRNSRTDTCKGDSGGPLICNGKIEGIVSFGDGCDNPEHLGVYTRVYTHLDWIQKQINSGSVTFLQASNMICLTLSCVLVCLNRHVYV